MWINRTKIFPKAKKWRMRKCDLETGGCEGGQKCPEKKQVKVVKLEAMAQLIKQRVFLIGMQQYTNNEISKDNKRT